MHREPTDECQAARQSKTPQSSWSKSKIEREGKIKKEGDSGVSNESNRLADFFAEPNAGIGPDAFGSARGDVHGGGGLLHGHADEVP
jgi:hypothetical protein